MKHTEYVYIKEWFAWRPIRITGTWKFKWLTKVMRIIDDRPEVYSGLLPTTVYNKI